MPTIWYNGTVRSIEPLTPTVRRFLIETPEPLPFEAGQFITCDLPIGEKRLHRWRSYSIANMPEASNLLELCIVRSEKSGSGTQYLFETLKTGDTIKFKGPEGGFVLPESIETDLVFICTGTGVAPFRSMIQELHRSGKPHRQLHLIFGCRTEADILYRAEFEALAQEWPHFRYDVALSRQPDWPGHKGYVHDVYLQQYAEKRPDVLFYLCGWSAMIDEAVANLITRLGYGPAQVKYELYG